MLLNMQYVVYEPVFFYLPLSLILLTFHITFFYIVIQI